MKTKLPNHSKLSINLETGNVYEIGNGNLVGRVVTFETERSFDGRRMIDEFTLHIEMYPEEVEE